MNPFADKVAEEIRDTWQARALIGSADRLQRVLIAAFAKEYRQVLMTLVRAIGYGDINTPFLCGYASVSPAGRVICDLVDHDRSKRKVAVFCSEAEMIYSFRKLADKLKLSDKDRSEMFRVLQKWITSDHRVNELGQRQLAS